MCVLIKKIFSSFKETSTSTVSMGNGSMTYILGEDQVKLGFSSRNYLILN